MKQIGDFMNLLLMTQISFKWLKEKNYLKLVRTGLKGSEKQLNFKEKQ